jgi:hypothetical protein
MRAMIYRILASCCVFKREEIENERHDSKKEKEVHEPIITGSM